MPQLTLRQKELVELGQKKGLIRLAGARIEYCIQGKAYQFTDPEEPVRAAAYVELAERYVYPPERIDFEQQAPSRQPPYPADIVVYEDDAHSRAFIVAECKPTSQPGDLRVGRREGLGNANLFGADYLLVAAGDELEAYDVRNRPSLRALHGCRIADLPVSYAQPPQFKYRKGGSIFEELRRLSVHELNSKFQRCHNAIWEAGRRGPDEAFDEMSKLMFAKLYDERMTQVGDFYRFQVGAGDNGAQVAARVKALYDGARRGEPAILQDEIEVSDDIVLRVVETLQDGSLSKTDLDAKGQAFEKFLGKVFRGELGQFFTPRQVTDFMVKFADPGWEDLILDPACGSGGFLLYAMDHVAQKVRGRFEGDHSSIQRITWDFTHRNVFGVEINRRIARIAMMDMVIHDDGHANIECNDALLDYPAFDPRRDIRPGKYDIVLTNPPFGHGEERRTVLERFGLGRGRQARRSEVLFIERCIELVRPGGQIGIVLPDGVLNNVNDRDVRAFIDEKAVVAGVISLPVQTFLPFGSGMQTSVVFLRRRSDHHERWGHYPVFMATASSVGYDSTGRDIASNDLPSILDAYKAGGSLEFATWMTPEEVRTGLGLKELGDSFTLDRMDPKYYYLAPRIDDGLRKIGCPVARLASLCVAIKSGARPAGRAMYFRGNIPSLEGGNVDPYGGLLLDDLKYIPDEFHVDHLDSAVGPSDILIVKDGATTGKVAIVPPDFPFDDCNVNEHLFKLRVNSDLVEPYYVFGFLYSELGQLQVQREITGGAQKGITRPVVENLVIPVPSRKVQERVGDIARQGLRAMSDLSAQIVGTQRQVQAEIAAALER